MDIRKLLPLLLFTSTACYGMEESISPSDLPRNAGLVSKSLTKDDSSKLGKAQEIVIKSSKDLDSFLKKETEEGQRAPDRPTQVTFTYEPSDRELAKLLMRDDLQIVVPPPREGYMVTPRSIEKAKSLLPKKNIKIAFLDKNDDLGDWKLVDIGKLWDSLDDLAIEDQDLIRSKITSAFSSYSGGVTWSQAINTLNAYPFLAHIYVDTGYGGRMGEETLNDRIAPVSLSCSHGMLAGKELEILTKINCLISIDLSNSRFCVERIGKQGMISLGEAIKNSPALTSLNLRGNQIRAEGVQTLASAIKSSSTLTVLDLADNRIRAEGVQTLVNAIMNSPALTSLNLSGNKIRDDGVAAVAKGLMNHPVLTSVRLDDNHIGDKGAEALADTINESNSIVLLDLSGNDIGTEGARALGGMLRENKSLASLRLTGNNLGDKGIEYIVDGLMHNHTLKKLSLVNTGVTSQGAKAIAKLLENNTSLKKLELDANKKIRTEGANFLAEALKKNTTLKSLHLYGTKIGEEGKEALRQLQESHPLLKMEF